MKWGLLFCGGGLGAIMRFGLALWVDQRTPPSFPWGTFAVNVVGCFAIGLLVTWADARHGLGPALRLFLVAGVLGGFTTFSTFSLETWELIDAGWPLAALGNALGSLAACMTAVVAGVLLGRAIA